jgi:hypothetical protein
LTESTKIKKPRAAITESACANSSIPAGFPKSIASSTAWTGIDFENGPEKERYSLILNKAQIAELEQACLEFESKSI